MLKNCIIISVLFLSVFTTALWSESGVLSYLEGRVTLERSGSPQKPAEIGDTLVSGDTLYTDSKSFAEVELASGSTLSIKEGSVFNFGEIADNDSKSGKRGFFRVLLGNVSFKFKNLLREPEVGTPLAVLAVRGTDFTVYTAPDGASMTVVSDGLVEVSSGGQTVLLAADQGVEVAAGLGLGETFDARKGFVRYDAFVQQALERSDSDPVGSLNAIAEQFYEYAQDGKFFLDSWKTNYEEVQKTRSQIDLTREKKGDEAAAEIMQTIMKPLQLRSLDLNRTYRFNFISGLYLRRYVISSYYIRFRTKFLTDTGNPEWQKFLEAYKDVLDVYDNQLIPFLEDEDL